MERRRWPLALVVVALLVVGCGGDDESTTTSNTDVVVGYGNSKDKTPKPPKPDPAEAHDELRSLAAEAAQLLDGINLYPSEHGAAITFNEGVVDREHFCKTDAVAYDTDTIRQAERAWADGWTSEGGNRTDGLALYNAMSISCFVK